MSFLKTKISLEIKKNVLECVEIATSVEKGQKINPVPVLLRSVYRVLFISVTKN